MRARSRTSAETPISPIAFLTVSVSPLASTVSTICIEPFFRTKSATSPSSSSKEVTTRCDSRSSPFFASTPSRRKIVFICIISLLLFLRSLAGAGSGSTIAFRIDLILASYESRLWAANCPNSENLMKLCLDSLSLRMPASVCPLIRNERSTISRPSASSRKFANSIPALMVRTRSSRLVSLTSSCSFRKTATPMFSRSPREAASKRSIAKL